MPDINYTTQTNSHEGFTIEELKRLFIEGKPLTAESMNKLISNCFNYELVSGKGLRIIELKNNNFRNNTTKTYKIECTETHDGSGSGSGGGGSVDIYADKGLKFDIDGQTIIASLYDYEADGDVEDENVYPVSLSNDGKLIVNMNESELLASSSSKYSFYAFENTDIANNFSFSIILKGNKINVSKIETWVDENGVTDPSSIEIYDESSSYIQDLNNVKHTTIYKSCSARLNVDSPDDPVVRVGYAKIYYTDKSVEQEPRLIHTTTKFIHPIYYGYTCDYLTTKGSEHISPERRRKNPNERTQPCFKVYSNNPSDYEGDSDPKRIGLELRKTGNNYDMIIQNTEKSLNYTLGYYDNNAKHTIRYTPTTKTFKLNGLTDHGDESVFIVFMVPKHMNSFTSMKASVDGGTEYSILESMQIEKTIVTNHAYDESSVINTEYSVYTMENSFSTFVRDYIEIQCTIKNI